MDDPQILHQIKALVEAEHELRQRHLSAGAPDPAVGRELHELEVSLDQCWDLLRQRRARREFGQDPQDAGARGADQVEGYLQ